MGLPPAEADAARPAAGEVVVGITWGVWHWPLILMGHNYGLDCPGYPWPGLLAMVWFTFTVGTFFGWLAYQGGSV